MELGALYATKRVAEYANQSLLFRCPLINTYCVLPWYRHWDARRGNKAGKEKSIAVT